MKTFFYISYFLLFANLSCKTHEINKNSIVTIEITNIDYGKISDKFDKIELSKITKVKKENFTSAISGIHMNKKVTYPINDIVFNHYFFNNFDYNQSRKLKLSLQRYYLKDKEFLVAIKIE